MAALDFAPIMKQWYGFKIILTGDHSCTGNGCTYSRMVIYLLAKYLLEVSITPMTALIVAHTIEW